MLGKVVVGVRKIFLSYIWLGRVVVPTTCVCLFFRNNFLEIKVFRQYIPVTVLPPLAPSHLVTHTPSFSVSIKNLLIPEALSISVLWLWRVTFQRARRELCLAQRSQRRCSAVQPKFSIVRFRTSCDFRRMTSFHHCLLHCLLATYYTDMIHIGCNSPF